MACFWDRKEGAKKFKATKKGCPACPQGGAAFGAAALGGGLHSCVIDILCASCPAQLQHPLLSPESKGLLEMARSAVGCSQHFAKGVDAIRTVVNDGGHQRIVVEHLASCRFGRLAPTSGDGFYVFRVAPKGSNGWLFHAVVCVVSGGDACWSEKTSGAYEGCRVTVVDIKKRRGSGPSKNGSGSWAHQRGK